MWILGYFLKPEGVRKQLHFRNRGLLWSTTQIWNILFIKKIQQDATMYQHFIIPYLYEAQHVLGDTPPIIRSLKLHWQPLVFHTWKAVGCYQAQCAWQRLPTKRPTTFHVWKTRGCQCSFRLLMMGGVSPKTCWASYKYGIIKCWYIVASCWIFFMNCTMIHGSTNVKSWDILFYTFSRCWDWFTCVLHFLL